MSRGVGPLRKIACDGSSIRIPNDVETNFFAGGWVVSEVEDDVEGATPVKAFRVGRLTGLTARAVDAATLTKLHDLVKKSTDGPLDLIFEFASGAKYGGSTIIKVDVDSFFESSSGKTTMDFFAESGRFTPVK